MLSCTKEFAQGPAGGPSYSNIAEASRVLLLLDLKFSDAVCSFNYDFISKTLSITLNANVQKVTWRFLWWFLWLNCGSTVAQLWHKIAWHFSYGASAASSTTSLSA